MLRVCFESRLLKALILGLFFCVFEAYSQDNFRLGGHIQIDYSGDLINEAPLPRVDTKLEIDTPRRDSLRASIELQSDEGSRRIELNDSYVDYRFPKNRSWSLRFGRARRDLGFENEDGVRTRIGLRRSPLYQEMGNLGWMARDTFLRLRFRDTNRFALAFHVNEANDAMLLGSAETPLSSTISWTSWGAYLQYGRMGGSYPFFIVGSGLRYLRGNLRSEFEVFAGQNPVDSLVSTNLNDEILDRVYLAATRFGLSYALGSYRPYLQLNIVRPSWAKPEGQLIAIIPGISYSIADDLLASIELDINQRTSYVSSESKTWRFSTYRLNLRYFL